MTPDKGERVVAAFEAAKGLLVLLVGFGLLRVVNEDLQRVAEELGRNSPFGVNATGPDSIRQGRRNEGARFR